MKQMYVYIVTNHKHGTLYIGVTNNLVRRTYEHRNKLIEGFTKQHNLTKLVYYEIWQGELEAIEREKKLKKAYRKYKISLIEKQNPDWNDLYDSIV
ncbi:MAG: GIY-YIG nuclease family protein [Alphaproteobacteria bacterium]|nr:GIY-YIG nuclease family protein [Alphaproteobacteria bacterium]